MLSINRDVMLRTGRFFRPQTSAYRSCRQNVAEGAPMMERAMEHTAKWPGAGTGLSNTLRFIGMLKDPGVFRATINQPSPICANRGARA